MDIIDELKNKNESLKDTYDIKEKYIFIKKILDDNNLLNSLSIEDIMIMLNDLGYIYDESVGIYKKIIENEKRYMINDNLKEDVN